MGTNRTGLLQCCSGSQGTGQIPSSCMWQLCASRTCCALTFHTSSVLALAHAEARQCLSRQCRATACGYACRGGCLLFMAELFCRSANEKLLVHLGWVQLGSLRYSPDMGRSYLTSPQLRNVLVISDCPGCCCSERSDSGWCKSFVWEIRRRVTCHFCSLAEQCQ